MSNDRTPTLLTIEQRVKRLCLRLSFAMLFAFAAIMISTQAILMHDRAREQLQEMSGIVATNSAAALAFGNPGDAAEVLRSLQGSRWLASVAVYDAQARVFASYSGPRAACLPVAPKPEGLSFTWCGARWSEPIALHGRTIGHVSTVIGLSSFWTALAQTILISIVVVAGLMGAAMFFAHRTARRITRPLSALASTAEQVAYRHDFELRANIDGTPEIRAVAKAFNVMLDKLALRDHRLRQLSHLDALTGLSNRRAYEECLARSVREARVQGSHCVLLYLDLDGFKAVNDHHGHAAGDAVLRSVAARLRQSVRQSDFCCRLGGDEFAVVLGDQRTLCASQQLAENIRQKLGEAYTHLGQTLPRVSASVGVAVFPDDAGDAEELVRHADQAMYRAKAAGRKQVRYFSAGGKEPLMSARTRQSADVAL